MTTLAAVESQTRLWLPMGARWAMAVCAVLAPGLTLAGFLLDTAVISLEDEQMIQHLATRLDDYSTQAWLSAIAAVLWVPAVLMLGRVARPNAPILGLVGFVFAFGLAIPSGLDPYELAYVGLKGGLPTNAILGLIEASGQVPSSTLGLAWLFGLIGLILLGIAVLRGKAAPRWVAIVLIAAPLSVPLTFIAGSAVAAAAPWVLLTAAFTGCATELIKQGKSEQAAK